jgi:sugar/nucleoside kinase (ribokinase family)
VDCAVRVAPGAVTGSVVVLSQAHERTMLCDRGANALLSTVDIELPRDAVHLHLSGYVLFDGESRAAGRHALATAAGQGMTTSVDAASAGPLRLVGGPAFLDWVRAADVLFANLDEARALLSVDAPPAELAARLAGHVRHAVVKLGADGAIWASRDGALERVPAQPATVADPTGAGDAFAAGLLTAWLSGATPRDALISGTTLGAQAVSTPGARPPP